MKNKITIFIPTGEIRKLKKGEYFENDTGDFLEWFGYEESKTSFNIYIKQEIEIPKNMKLFQYAFINSLTKQPFEMSDIEYIPITCNNKIKKWRWITNINGYMEITNYMTVEEIKEYCQNYKNVLWYEKVINSEKEFDYIGEDLLYATNL